ncbi:MAG: hypothetical protein KJ667_00565, partial [Alphaproteobacteria bacterium]|nr:hypothetical protein [Alphaproteobacteria bacterium]
MADITGTNGNDILVFNGMVQQLTMTITNAYSGQSLFIDDEYNNNQSSYEGMAGIDVLTMSSQGDAIFITNSVGVQMLFNIEQILAGQGGDLIVLAHETIELGNVIVDGGAGDDIVWSNIGDDLLRGLGGNDIIDGGPGNDNIQGLNDNDILNGGADADWLQGGNGNDVLEFYADAVWGAGAGTVNVITGEIADLEGLNRSFDTFDGGANNDALTMTGGDDALVLDDPVSARHASTSGARIVAVEVIDGGAGNDVINLTSATYAYGNVTIYGGAGHDVLWSGAGHDVLDGGIGDDRLHGGEGHDILSGGTGTDQLDGGIGDDTLVFSVDDVDGTGRGVTFDTYVGGAGTDTLLMGAGDDAFAFDGTNLNGVEIIAAGLGHDHINLDHATAYGNVTVDAGAGDDYVRASSGDDLLLGGDGDDTLFGNLGNDRVEGGAGNDILYGGDEGSVTTLTHQFNGAVAFPTLTELQALSQAEEAALGLADGDLSVAYTTTATIKFVESGAGYKNSLGYYNIAADGTMQAVEMAFSHVKAAMQGQTYDVTLPGAPDTDFGFFIIADGYSHNNNYSGVNFAT